MTTHASCPPCAGTGEFPPEDGETCPWCDGEGDIEAAVADRLIEARRNYQARKRDAVDSGQIGANDE